MRPDTAAHDRAPGGHAPDDAPPRPLTIAVSGADGHLGAALVPFLAGAGHRVLRFVHGKPRDAETEIFWDHSELTIDAARLEGVDAVIHLPPDNVLTMRWSDQKKMQIYASRVRRTELLAKTLARLHAPPRVLLSASALSYYGSRGDEALPESAPPGQKGFLSALTQDWEAATAPAADAGIRTVQMRLGLVLDPAGGPLAKMRVPFALGLGGRYGAPDQYLAWIDRDDALRAIAFLLAADGLEGPFNVVAPQPVTAEVFARTLGRVLRRPAWLHLSPLVFRLLYGDVADETLLQSARAYPERLLTSGFTFAHPYLEPALRHLLGRPAAHP